MRFLCKLLLIVVMAGMPVLSGFSTSMAQAGVADKSLQQVSGDLTQVVSEEASGLPCCRHLDRSSNDMSKGGCPAFCLALTSEPADLPMLRAKLPDSVQALGQSPFAQKPSDPPPIFI